MTYRFDVHQITLVLPSLFLAMLVSLPVYSQQDEWALKPDSLLAPLTYPARFDRISVLGCFRKDVTRWFGNGYYSEEGGHGGTSYFVDAKRRVVLRVEWGVDRHVDEISFSYGAKEDLPDSFNSLRDFPDSTMSRRLRPTLLLEGGISLGLPPRKILRAFGRPATDTVMQGVRNISYTTDYRTTRDVLAYVARFHFKDGKLVRFTIYNGE